MILRSGHVVSWLDPARGGLHRAQRQFQTKFCVVVREEMATLLNGGIFRMNGKNLSFQAIVILFYETELVINIRR